MLTLTKKISASICSSLNITGEAREVLEYGMIALVQILILIPAILIIGLFTGTMWSALIICFTASFLRKYTGGVHVSSINICTIIGVTFCMSASVLIQYLLAQRVNLVWLAVILVSCYSLALVVITKKVPVDTPNKPINTEKKKKRLRKAAFIILASYAFVSMVLFYVSFRFNVTTIYIWSILFGLMWQILTLTQMGAIFIGWVDKSMTMLWRTIKGFETEI